MHQPLHDKVMTNPLKEYEGEPVLGEPLEIFRKAYTTATNHIYVPAGLWELADGTYLVELKKPRDSAGGCVFSSNDLAKVETDVIYWESLFDRSVYDQGSLATAFALGSFMDRTGDWHYYALLAHIGEPPAKRKSTAARVVKTV